MQQPAKDTGKRNKKHKKIIQNGLHKQLQKKLIRICYFDKK
jgi:hypothetical protein